LKDGEKQEKPDGTDIALESFHSPVLFQA